MYGAAIGMGMTIGAGIGNAIGGFFLGDAAQKTYQLQGQVALLNASAQAETLRANAQSVSETAGKQEYAMYKQQKTHLAKMEASTAANGVMLEGTAVDVMAAQAETDAQNRASLIQGSKNTQEQLIFSAQQTLQQGYNQQAYYNAMGKAAKANAIMGGINSLFSSAQSFNQQGVANYRATGSYFG